MGRRKKLAHDLEPLAPWLTPRSANLTENIRLRRQHATASRQLETARRDRRALQHQHRSIRHLSTGHPLRSILPSRLYARDVRGQRRDPHRRHLYRFLRTAKSSATASPPAADNANFSLSFICVTICMIACLVTTVFARVMGVSQDSYLALGLVTATCTAFATVTASAALTCKREKESETTSQDKLSQDKNSTVDPIAEHMRQAEDSIRKAKATLSATFNNSQDSPERLAAEARRLMSLLPGSPPKTDDFQSIVFDRDGTPVTTPVDNSPMVVMSAMVSNNDDHTAFKNCPARVVKKDVKDTKQRPVPFGEIGQIIDTDINAKINGVRYTQVAFRRLDPQVVWVPFHSLEINTTKKWGDISIHANIVQPSLMHLNRTPLQPTDYPITHLAHQLCGSIMAGSDTDRILPNAFYTIMKNQENIIGFARKLGDAVERAGLSAAFDIRNQWAIRDFVAKAPMVSEKKEEKGIYMGVYSNFKPDSKLAGQLPRNYIGKTTQGFHQRWIGHDSDIRIIERGGDGMEHHKIAAQAQGRAKLVLAIADDSWSGDDYMFAEQVLILIMRAYRPQVIDLEHQASGAGSTTKAPPGETTESLAATLTDRFVASELTAIAESLFTWYGWGKWLNTFGGCNWQSPFFANTEYYEPLLWVKVDLGDRWSWFRKPKRVTETKNNGIPYREYMSFKGPEIKGKDNKPYAPSIRLEEPAGNPGPPKDAMIYMSVEIMEEGRHSHSLARLPDIGGPTNWEEASQVGFRIQWKDKQNKWWIKYYQSAGDFKQRDSNRPGSHYFWVYATAIRNKLERKAWARGKDDPRVPSYWWDLFSTMILELKWDAFQQRFTITQAPRHPDPVPFPTIDYEGVRDKMAKLGLGRFGSAKPSDDQSKEWDLNSGRKGPRRRFCDTVAVYEHRLGYGHGGGGVVGRAKAAQHFPGQCEFCALFGRAWWCCVTGGGCLRYGE